MSIIKPEYLTFDDLLQKKFFEIPNYQRTYSWMKKQRDDLFNDIKQISTWNDSERHHFMATVVCLHKKDENKRVGTDEYKKFEIVDGQQRITTLIILLKAICKILSLKSKKEKEESKKLNEILVKKDKRLVLLQTNHDNHHIFRNYLEKGVIPDKANIKTFTDMNLTNAFKECEDFAKDWNKGDILDLLSVLKNRLGFIFYVLEDQGSVYSVFEVLNSRGLDVDWLDKCKSMLMGIIFDKYPKLVANTHINELHKTWIRIYRAIGLLQISGEEIIKFVATLKISTEQNKVLGAEDAIEYFHKICTKNPERIFTITELLLTVTEYLRELDVNIRQKAVSKIIHSRLLWIAIKMSKLENGEKLKLLDQWERTSFRIHGLYRRDSRYSVGDFVRLSQDIYKNKSSFKEYMKEFKKIGADYPIEDIEEKIWEKDSYHYWENEVRYFFYRYEESLTKNKGNVMNEAVWIDIWNNSSIKSIEHIYPQKPNENSKDWRGKLGKGKDVIENNKHRLGNLVLLPPGVNTLCSNKKFKLKKDIYKQQMLRLLKEIIECRDWNLSQINKREKFLIKWAKETWCDLN